MRKIDYSDWAQYLSDIFDYTNVKTDTILELACGNGTLFNHFKRKFEVIILSDISFCMLKQSESGKTNLVCCDMLKLPFHRKFNVVYSTFDSINYIMNEKDLGKFFRGIKRIIGDEAIMTFDVSLEKNSIKNLKHLNRKGKFKGIRYTQESDYRASQRIHYNHFTIMLPDGSIVKETHKQKIFDFFTYFEVIEKSGLFVQDCFDAFSFEDADPESERVQFILRKQ